MRSRKTGEFKRIARIFAPLAKPYPGALGLLDDAALVEPSADCEFVVTTDTIVAGVHYVGDEPASAIGRKLLRVNLSDLAAMGARPCVYTLNIALPDTVDDAWLEDFAMGLSADQTQFGIVLAGGDSVATPGPTTLTLTAIGEVARGKALRRSGAGVGDIVYVSGTIGDGALGLKAVGGALPGLSPADCEWLAGRYRIPEPRLGLGQALVGLATAALDVSDGLVGDLGHIAEASGVGCVVEAARVPLSAPARAALTTDPELRETVLTGGDDYELLFTLPAEQGDAVARAAADAGVPVAEIGRVVAGQGVQVLDEAGQAIELTRTGYVHV
jgi:thiamine-monophosphate kinase